MLMLYCEAPVPYFLLLYTSIRCSRSKDQDLVYYIYCYEQQWAYVSLVPMPSHNNNI